MCASHRVSRNPALAGQDLDDAVGDKLPFCPHGDVFVPVENRNRAACQRGVREIRRLATAGGSSPPTSIGGPPTWSAPRMRRFPQGGAALG
jgi:hypothetical protein